MQRMAFAEAKARIIRFNEGGTLFEFDNELLRRNHLKCMVDSLILNQHKKDFLCGILQFASLIAPANPKKYKQHKKDYRRLYRTAHKMLAELDSAEPTLF